MRITVGILVSFAIAGCQSLKEVEEEVSETAAASCLIGNGLGGDWEASSKRIRPDDDKAARYQIQFRARVEPPLPMPPEGVICRPEQYRLQTLMRFQGYRLTAPGAPPGKYQVWYYRNFDTQMNVHVLLGPYGSPRPNGDGSWRVQLDFADWSPGFEIDYRNGFECTFTYRDPNGIQTRSIQYDVEHVCKSDQHPF